MKQKITAIIASIFLLGNLANAQSLSREGDQIEFNASDTTYRNLVELEEKLSEEYSKQSSVNYRTFIKQVSKLLSESGIVSEEKFELMVLEEGVVLFLNVQDIAKVYYLKLGRRRIFRRDDLLVSPSATVLSATKNFWAFYIVDKSNYISNTIQVNYSGSLDKSKTSSYESPYLYRDYSKNTDLHIGYKRFKNYREFPGVEVTFKRENIETGQIQKWSRSYSVYHSSNPIDVGISVPLTKTVTGQKLFFVMSLDVYPKSPKINSELMRRIVDSYPNFLFGVGLLYDLNNTPTNGYLIGYSWLTKSKVLGFTFAYQDSFQGTQTFDENNLYFGLNISLGGVNNLFKK